MTGMAAHLGLEHSNHPLRFDIARLTLMSDTPDGPVAMRRVGGGENWVGHHLVVHLAFPPMLGVDSPGTRTGRARHRTFAKD
jgi:hypothetical protein